MLPKLLQVFMTYGSHDRQRNIQLALLLNHNNLGSTNNPIIWCTGYYN